MDREREPLPTRVADTPDLPPAYHDALDAGLAAMGIALDAPAREAIDGHIRLLLTWTRAINLTAVRDPQAAATVHVLDSLAGVAPLRARGVDALLDLGSGGGLPGIPLAAGLPARDALLVEPIGKKARFLATVIEATGLEATTRVAATRAETLAGRPPAPRSLGGGHGARGQRAGGPRRAGLPAARRAGCLVAWKRGDLDAELAAARRAVDALGGGDMEVIDPGVPGSPGNRLVIVTRTGVVPAAYPRDPSARRRRPW